MRERAAYLSILFFAPAAFALAGSAFAQDSDSRWRPVSNRRVSTVSAQTERACNTCEEPRFWVVSSRRCPQRAKGCAAPCCRFDEFVYQNGRCTAVGDSAAFQKWLIPGAPVTVIVHGSFTSFKALLAETCAMSRWLRRAEPRRPLNIVVFTWPSDDVPTGLISIDINVLGRRSGFNGFYLAQFMQRIPKGSRVCLIGHSHGARTVASFLHLQSGGSVQRRTLCKAQPCAWRLRAVLLAAAIDHHWLNPRERYGRALCGTEALLNMRNRRDLPLSFYPLRRPFSHRALGRSGFTRKDRRQLGNWNARICELDVTRMIGRRHFWVYYFHRPEISAAIAPYVHFTDDDARAAKKQPTPAAKTSERRPVRETFSRIRRVSARQR